MIEHKLFVGANNKTGEVEVDKIIEIVGHYFAGFTVQEAIGVWQGKREKSVVVTIIANNLAEHDVHCTVADLTVSLDQEFVLRTSQPVKTNLR
jgi:hypothetical protein